jgi:hypothetical protein
MNDTGHLTKFEQGLINCDIFKKTILPELRELYDINILHRGTMQTRIVNKSNGKKIDYYPYYRKINNFQYKTWMLLANDGEINTAIKLILR